MSASESGQKNEMTLHISPQSVVTTLLILLAFGVAFLLRDLILVVLAAVIIAAALEPGIRHLKQYHISRVPAAIIIYLLLVAAIAAIAVFLIRPLIGQALQFVNSVPQYLESIAFLNMGGEQAVKSADASANGAAFSVQQVVQQVRGILGEFTGGAVTVITNIFGGVTSFLLIVVLSFYLCLQENGVLRFVRMVTPVRYEQYAINLWRRAEHKIGLWVQGQLILALIVGVLTYIGLWALGVPFALVLAFLAGVAELIPLLGPVLAAIPAIGIAGVEGGLMFAVIVAALYVVIQQLESNVIYPVVVQKVVGLSPIIVIIALVAGGQLGGFLGIVLSVPIAAGIMEFLNDVQLKKPMATEEKAGVLDKEYPNTTDIDSHV
jgi:predicted PurR-regulated permease PerM